MDAPAPTPPPRPAPAALGSVRARGRRLRWLAVVVVCAALGAWGWHSLTRGVIGRGIVMSVLRAATGCDAATSRVRVHPFGPLEVEGLVLSVPASAGVRGPAAQVLRAERVKIDLDWSGWAGGRVRPVSIALDHPVFRVSQDPEGRLNVAALGTGAVPGAGTGDVALPGLVASTARLEVEGLVLSVPASAGVR